MFFFDISARHKITNLFPTQAYPLSLFVFAVPANIVNPSMGIQSAEKPKPGQILCNRQALDVLRSRYNGPPFGNHILCCGDYAWVTVMSKWTNGRYCLRILG